MGRDVTRDSHLGLEWTRRPTRAGGVGADRKCAEMLGLRLERRLSRSALARRALAESALDGGRSMREAGRRKEEEGTPPPGILPQGVLNTSLSLVSILPMSLIKDSVLN
jgi:hypothetical protein